MQLTHILIVCSLASLFTIQTVANSLTDALRLKDDSKCILDTQCRTGQFCDTKFPNPVGECIEGKGEDEFCIKNSVCASNQCNFFKCKKRVTVKDGPCKHSVIHYIILAS